MAERHPSADEELRDQPLPFPEWGSEQIDDEARQQMRNAMRLPVSVAGALMPDAHVGYGLPIGGVLATENAVIPYAVGVDIACRMRLSVFPVSPTLVSQKTGLFKKALLEGTRFGAGAAWARHERPDHPVLDDPDWRATKLLASLHEIAYAQLGTSGTGNHFVNWSALKLERDDEQLGLRAGEYLALLSHSGSRAVGFKIANFYSKIAAQMHPELDEGLRHLGWLDLTTDIGREYWLSMALAGRFAAANHEIIHRRVAAIAGLKPFFTAENHHNFAWKARIPAPGGFQAAEREVIIHRKGATPAEKGVIGMIPGSMADSGYLVRGKGNPTALFSAAHGAGRQMSRKQALNSITKTARDRLLRERGVILLGGGLDESPQAYKPIQKIISAQADLVDVLGEIQPLMVRMADEAGDF
jgi:tRNA-splicing ligase RtcB